jgi:5-methylcytosine-specific restriction endonuclease McrA
VEFTARAELRDKVERARELLSHALPSGDLGELFERALDALIEQQTRERLGAGRPRKARKPKEGSRHVPVEIVRAVWERDHGQCTYVDAEGRRCSERRFVTLEHRHPFALGGPPTLDNVCLLCARHNAESARAVFGEQHI